MDGGKDLDFDSIMSRLEEVVARLEREDLPLEKAIEAYEQGVILARQGQDRLASAERRLQELNERGEITDMKAANLSEGSLE